MNTRNATKISKEMETPKESSKLFSELVAVVRKSFDGLEETTTEVLRVLATGEINDAVKIVLPYFETEKDARVYVNKLINFAVEVFGAMKTTGKASSSVMTTMPVEAGKKLLKSKAVNIAVQRKEQKAREVVSAYISDLTKDERLRMFYVLERINLKALNVATVYGDMVAPQELTTSIPNQMKTLDLITDLLRTKYNTHQLTDENLRPYVDITINTIGERWGSSWYSIQHDASKDSRALTKSERSALSTAKNATRDQIRDTLIYLASCGAMIKRPAKTVKLKKRGAKDGEDPYYRNKDGSIRKRTTPEYFLDSPYFDSVEFYRDRFRVFPSRSFAREVAGGFFVTPAQYQQAPTSTAHESTGLVMRKLSEQHDRSTSQHIREEGWTYTNDRLQVEKLLKATLIPTSLNNNKHWRERIRGALVRCLEYCRTSGFLTSYRFDKPKPHNLAEFLNSSLVYVINTDTLKDITPVEFEEITAKLSPTVGEAQDDGNKGGGVEHTTPASEAVEVSTMTTTNDDSEDEGNDFAPFYVGKSMKPQPVQQSLFTD